MDWEHSIWNYHKIALIIGLLIFILLTPPFMKFFVSHTKNGYWVAFVIALIIWSFVFIILKIYGSVNKRNQLIDYD